jgi:hypothetical protein
LTKLIKYDYIDMFSKIYLYLEKVIIEVKKREMERKNNWTMG